VARTVTGKRHEITLQRAVAGDVVTIQATCVCGQLKAPVRRFTLNAEEDGYDHMRNNGHIAGRVVRGRKKKQ